ncbi:SRPBCC family protein [Paenibacillus nasutitermitis]|uniref:Activator of HSP90 ATPase n=1 Tax=Paenibacillus nasutitermitis TaxID=1652958 RepID=A0A916Z935_9BACL|nr:SRPBCC family protein [Paenibacillus nasutitermitis]GGD82587.1 activator of HSP90 ATPase [Paenibacillus nasutitermitis]
MNERSVVHDTFVHERTYNTTPSRVFSAWSDPEVKATWFPKADTFDFTVGGREIHRGGSPGGEIYTYEALFQEIAADERIVYTYSMDQGDARISVSVVSVQFKAVENGTHLIYTEHGAFLDGYDTPAVRERGTKAMLDILGEARRQEV